LILLKLVPTVGTDFRLSGQILAAFGTGEGELGGALGTGLVVVVEGCAALGTEI
jgi:hypothetical protein